MRYDREYYSHLNEKNTLAKDVLHKKLSGVCAGVARHYGLPRWGVRAGAVVGFFMFPLAMIIAYLAATFLLDNK